MSSLLNRSEYGMTKYIPAISDEVNLNIQVEILKSKIYLKKYLNPVSMFQSNI